MTSTITNLINNKFAGIKRKNSSFNEEAISCSDCQNVELFFTNLNSGVGIRTAPGNVNVTRYIPTGEEEETSLIPSGEDVVEVFESVQDGNTYMLIYTESLSQGKIYNLNVESKTITPIVTGLTVTGKACATDCAQGYLDMFVFSNGVEMKYIYSDTTTHQALQVADASTLHLVDGEERTVHGLGLKVFDSRLWVFDGKVLWFSEQGDCRNFTPSGEAYTTDPGFIEFVKNITAIYPYLGSLAVFFSNSSCLVSLDSTTQFSYGDESPGGCASYKSLIFHGTDLYFYDDTKKGVFSFQQIVNGDKTLSDNIAIDLQEELTIIGTDELDKIKALSVITSDRNEVWFLVPISTDEDYSVVIIYDYIRGEWVKRKCQAINTASVVNNTLYSAGTEIYEEYVGTTFDGDFIESYFTCSTFNMGEDNTMKITKFPPRLTVDGNYKCKFWVKYVKNYQELKTPKTKKIETRQIPNVLKYDTGMAWNAGYLYEPNTINSIIKIPSATFKALKIQFYTVDATNQFAIKSIEFSKIKVKQV